MKNITFLLITLLFSSCCGWNWVAKHEAEVCKFCTDKYVTTDSSMTVKIDTFIIESYQVFEDSSLLELYFECDSNNNVLITSSNIKNSEYQRLQYRLLNNTLTVKSYLDSIKILNEQLNIEKLNYKEVIKTVVEKEVVKKVPAWMWVSLCGVILALIVILILAIKGIFR